MMRKVAGAAVALLISMLPLQLAHAAIEATEGWSRQTVPGIDEAVGYVTLKNTSTRKRSLLKISSPLAASIGLHQSSIDAQGVARMWPVGKLELEPGEVVRFTPNGRHLMLSGLKAPFLAGTRVPVTLVFEDEAPVTVQLDVKPLVDDAAQHPAGHMDHAHH